MNKETEDFTDWLMSRNECINFEIGNKTRDKLNEFKKKCKKCINRNNNSDLCSITLDFKGNAKCVNFEEGADDEA